MPQAGVRDGKARRDGGLTGRILALRRGQNLAQYHFADFAGFDLGAFQRRFDHHPPN